MREMGPVPVDLLVAAHHAINAERGDRRDELIVIGDTVRGKCSTWDVVSIYMRLYALTQVFKGTRSNEFIIYVIGQDYKIMNEVLLHAAAVAPLTYVAEDDEYVFDEAELMRLARELWNEAA